MSTSDAGGAATGKKISGGWIDTRILRDAAARPGLRGGRRRRRRERRGRSEEESDGGSRLL